jgi:hypothetical protein
METPTATAEPGTSISLVVTPTVASGTTLPGDASSSALPTGAATPSLPPPVGQAATPAGAPVALAAGAAGGALCLLLLLVLLLFLLRARRRRQATAVGGSGGDADAKFAVLNPMRGGPPAPPASAPPPWAFVSYADAMGGSVGAAATAAPSFAVIVATEELPAPSPTSPRASAKLVLSSSARRDRTEAPTKGMGAAEDFAVANPLLARATKAAESPRGMARQ